MLHIQNASMHNRSVRFAR